MAGAAWATATGAGIYVALAFAVFGVAWMAIVLVRRWYREAAGLCLAAAFAVLLAAPFFLRLPAPTQVGSGGGSQIQLTVRSFHIGEAIGRALGFVAPVQVAITNLLFLPLNYFLEFGFFFVVAVLAWRNFRLRRQPASRSELAAVTMFLASLLLCTFFSSSATHNNDLGWRGMLPAQFVLLLAAADLPAVSQRTKQFLRVLLAIGAAGVVYDLTVSRWYPVLADLRRVPTIDWMSGDRNLGERAYANRQAYEWIRAHTPSRAIVLQNPFPVVQDLYFGLYAERQTLGVSPACGSGYGGDAAECGRLAKLFSAAGPESGSAAFEAACSAFPVDVLVAKDTDRVWNDPESWVQTRPPAFRNGYVALYPCPSRRAGHRVDSD